MILIIAIVAATLEQTGEIQIKIDGPAESIVVFAADPARDAELLAEFGASGLCGYPSAHKIDAGVAKRDTGVTLTVKPGTYHVRLQTGPQASDGNAAVWLTDLRIEAGKSADAAARLGPGGSVKGTWTVDRSVQGKDGMVSTAASLVREGKVWAFARSTVAGRFEIKGVPPGTYALVVQDMFESFLSVTDGVAVEEGRETVAKVEVKRASLGGVAFEFQDKEGKPAAPPEGLVLADEKGRFASISNYAAQSGNVQTTGFIALPVNGRYALYGGGVAMKGIQLKVPTIRGEGVLAQQIYETVKVKPGGR